MVDLLDETLIELQEVADWLRVELQTVRNWTDRESRLKRGLPYLEADKIGGVIRTSREAVKRFRNAGKPEPITAPTVEARADQARYEAAIQGLKERHGLKDSTDEQRNGRRRHTA